MPFRFLEAGRLLSICLDQWVFAPNGVTGRGGAGNLARLWGLIKTGYEYLRHSVEFAAVILIWSWLRGQSI
jgi:hypothetical protein